MLSVQTVGISLDGKLRFLELREHEILWIKKSEQHHDFLNLETSGSMSA
jgi:hypothetical protein